MDINKIDLAPLEYELYEQFAGDQTQTLGFAQGHTITSQNAHAFLERLFNAEKPWQTTFIKNDLHRLETRQALRYWNEPTTTLSELRPLVTSTDDNSILIMHEGENIVVKLNKYGSGYNLTTRKFTVSYPIDKDGMVPGLEPERLDAYVKLVKLCDEVGYAYL